MIRSKLFKPILFILMMIFATVLNAQTITNQNLSAKQQALIRISAVTGKGELSKLKTELNTGLETGLTINQIREAIVHLYAYAGFPRSIRGLQTLMTVVDERKAKGIHDEKGADASLISDGRSKYERGKAILEELTGIPEKGLKTVCCSFCRKPQRLAGSLVEGQNKIFICSKCSRRCLNLIEAAERLSRPSPQ